MARDTWRINRGERDGVASFNERDKSYSFQCGEHNQLNGRGDKELIC